MTACTAAAGPAPPPPPLLTGLLTSAVPVAGRASLVGLTRALDAVKDPSTGGASRMLLDERRAMRLRGEWSGGCAPRACGGG